MLIIMFTILPPAEKRCKGTEKSAYMQTKIVESLFYFRYLIAINYGRYTVKNNLFKKTAFQKVVLNCYKFALIFERTLDKCKKSSTFAPYYRKI